MIHFQCTKCKAKIRVQDSAAEKKGECPECGYVARIPKKTAQNSVSHKPPKKRRSQTADRSPYDEVPYGLPNTAYSPSYGAQSCPMCGMGTPMYATRCPSCGEKMEVADEAPLPQIKTRTRKLKRSNSPILRKYRREATGLGVFWILCGSVYILLGIFFMIGASLFLDNGNGQIGAVVGLILIFFGMIVLTPGIFSCLKHLSAIYVGLIFSYIYALLTIPRLLTALDTVRFMVDMIVMLLAVGAIVQAHITIYRGHQLLGRNISPRSRPY